MQLRGEVANMRNAIQNFALAPLAVPLIYLVMVGLFRSFVDPTIILVAVPLGWIGTVLSAAADRYLRKRRIDDRHPDDDGDRGFEQHLLVDFANRMVLATVLGRTSRTRGGQAPHSADLSDGAGHDSGSLPLALDSAKGNETMVPLARAVVGGLAASTITSVVPVMHCMVLHRRERPPISATPGECGGELDGRHTAPTIRSTIGSTLKAFGVDRPCRLHVGFGLYVLQETPSPEHGQQAKPQPPPRRNMWMATRSLR
ncbi:MAG: hypothetical protein U0231_16680 [Nitrospiraceae bacterium]